MDLRPLLQSIRSIRDLPALTAALGHQPTWEPVAPLVRSRPDSRPLAMVVVGQSGKMPWFAVESRTAGKDAARLAQRISRRGKVALVLALDSSSSRISVAVAFDRCPSLEFDLTRPSPEELGSIERLAGGTESGALAYAARAAEALSIEPVGRRFFRQFKSTLDCMARALRGPISSTDRHGLALIQLTRVLFLYFIQSKGWLDQRERFMAEEVDRCLSRGRRIQRDFLRPLFFGTLNQPQSGRSSTARRFGAIPFLNGGLFEPHPLERRYRSDIPNPLWRDAFETLFERFHFTVSEGLAPGSIAPDMLGRVFEGVMDPDVRKASGTFYTPSVLVEQLVDAALAIHLSAGKHCTEAEALRWLENRDSRCTRLLRDITVLDHAVGSGAFLLVALDRLSAPGPRSSLARRKRQVLARSLFGVDKSSAAVRLTELRLWLSVVADDPGGSAQVVSPLPNLDCLIRQGDSLIEPSGLEVVAHSRCHARPLTIELARSRQQVIAASGSEKQGAVRQLRRLEAQALQLALQAAEHRQRELISGYLRQARTPDLFGHRRGLNSELRTWVKEARLSLRNLRAEQRRLAREGEVPWFHYQSAFADVFARGGFDLVIGNPPWLRSELIPSDARKKLRAKYRWWRARGGYGGSPDLSIAFLERAFDLAAAGGTVAMLVPAKIATAGYGAAARHGLVAGTTLHVLANLTGKAEAAFDATVYPMALVAGKSAPPADQWIRTDLSIAGGNRILQSQLSGGAPWVLSQSRLGELLRELRQNHPGLSQSLNCQLGVKTGLNHVFLYPPADIEPELLRWAVRGRDVRSFRCRPKLRLLWTHGPEGEPLSVLPPRARAHIGNHESELRSRRDFVRGPVWSVFRVRGAVARYRVVWPDLAKKLTAAALISCQELELIPLNSCYLTTASSPGEAQALAGWLNSSWIRAIAAVGAVPASGGFLRFNARTVNQLPLPFSALRDPELAELSAKSKAGKSVAGELDAVVARHLRLSSTAQKVLREAAGTGSLDRC